VCACVCVYTRACMHAAVRESMCMGGGRGEGGVCVPDLLADGVCAGVCVEKEYACVCVCICVCRLCACVCV